MKRQILCDGLTPDQLLALPHEEIDGLVATGEPVVFRAGSAEILAQFTLRGDQLLLDLVHVEGGGEGVLPALHILATQFAKLRPLRTIEWRVDATNCARPNPKLQRVLVRRGFAIRDVEGIGLVYHLSQPVTADTDAV